MLKASKREKEGWLRVEDIETFPCSDLRTIDQLWVKYSNGHFGFSVQKRIWEEVGGTPKCDYETVCKFGKHVGWQTKDNWLNYSKLTFTTQGPVGHLPVVRVGGVGGVLVFDWCWGGVAFWEVRYFSSLAPRLVTCYLMS